MRAFGLMVVMPFLKVINLTDPMVSFYGVLSGIIYFYFVGTAVAPWDGISRIS
jgi:hypothetical protein